MENYFQNSIYRIPYDYDEFIYLPSPNQLKRKILLKSTGNLKVVLQ